MGQSGRASGRGNFFSTRVGGGRGGGRGGKQTGSSSAVRLRGLFADGAWMCDCKPRLPASRFRVKKEGNNHGRWFYTCQQNEDMRCGFFLWEDDAKPREEAAVLSNSRTEPMRQKVSGGAEESWRAGRERPAEGPSGKGLFARRETLATAEDDEMTLSSSSPTLPSSSPEKGWNGAKRTARDARVAAEDDLDLFPWPMTGQEEADLVRAADMAAPETPRKAHTMGVYATPATTGRKRKLPWLEEEPTTPALTKTDNKHLKTPSKVPAVRVLRLEPETPQAPPTTASATTPTTPYPPSRHKDALNNPADSESSLTSEALDALSPVHVPPDVLSSLRSILSKHDLKTQGIAKGRDISRLALKVKDAKIAELQARIAGMEADKEVLRQLGRTWKADGEDMTDLYG